MYLSTKLFQLKKAKTSNIDPKKFSLTYRLANKNPNPIIKSINAGANRSLFYKNNKL
jgi:hypothetical protein